MCWF